MYDQNSIKNEESRAKRIGKKIMFTLFCVLFAGLIFIIIFRNAMMQPTSRMKQLLWNDKLISAKSEYGDDLTIYTLYEYNSTIGLFRSSSIYIGVFWLFCCNVL